MQRTTWHRTLSPLLQRDNYRELSEAILAHNIRFNQFRIPDAQEIFRLPDRGHSGLLERAKCRNAAFCAPTSDPTGLMGNASCLTDHDYTGRDREACTDGCKNTMEVSSLIKDWPAGLDLGSIDLYDRLSSQRTLSGFGKKFGTPQVSELLSLKLHEHWGSLYPYFASQRKNQHTWALTFRTGILAYGGKASMTDIRVLLAFAFSASIQPERSLTPRDGTYQLWFGKEPDHQLLRSIIIDNQRSPSASEDLSMHRQKVTELVDKLFDHILIQWPCSKPALNPKNNLYPKLNVQRIQEAIVKHFRTWHENYTFHQHLKTLEVQLSSMQAPHPIVASQVYMSLPWRPLPAGTKKGLRSLSDLLAISPAATVESAASTNASGTDGADTEVVRLTGMPTVSTARTVEEASELKSILDQLASGPSTVTRKYADDLLELESTQQEWYSECVPLYPA